MIITYVIDITDLKLNAINNFQNLIYMIDKKTEYIYNIILSIFLGIIVACGFNSLFDKPRIIDVYK